MDEREAAADSGGLGDMSGNVCCTRVENQSRVVTEPTTQVFGIFL